MPSHGLILERFQRFYTAALPKNDCRSPFFVFFVFFVSASFVGLSFDGRLLPSTDKADLGLRRGDIDGLDTAQQTRTPVPTSHVPTLVIKNERAVAVAALVYAHRREARRAAVSAYAAQC